MGQELKKTEYRAFVNCQKLEEIYSLIPNPEKCELAFGAFEETVLNNAQLYVPVGTLEQYKNAKGWKDFKNISEIKIMCDR